MSYFTEKDRYPQTWTKTTIKTKQKSHQFLDVLSEIFQLKHRVWKNAILLSQSFDSGNERNIFPKWVENKSKRKLKNTTRGSRKYLGKLSFFPQPLPLFPHLPLFAHLPRSASWWTVLAPLGTPTFDSLRLIQKVNMACCIFSKGWTVNKTLSTMQQQLFWWMEGWWHHISMLCVLIGRNILNVCMSVYTCMRCCQSASTHTLLEKRKRFYRPTIPLNAPEFSKPSPSKQLQPTRKTICEFPSKDSQPQKNPYSSGHCHPCPYLSDFFLATTSQVTIPIQTSSATNSGGAVVVSSCSSRSSKSNMVFLVPWHDGMGRFFAFPERWPNDKSNNGKNVERFFWSRDGTWTTWEWLAMQQATRNNKWIERITTGQEEGIFW